MNNDNNRLKLPVILTLTDGRELTVDLIVNLGGAIDRTMNNEASYILVGDSDGSERLLAKSAVLEVVDAKKAKPKSAVTVTATVAATTAAVTPAPMQEHQLQAPGLVPDISDPYQVLGLTPAASVNDIRNTFTAHAQAYNPDRIAALGLPQDVNEFCSGRYQQISEAYCQAHGRPDPDIGGTCLLTPVSFSQRASTVRQFSPNSWTRSVWLHR